MSCNNVRAHVFFFFLSNNVVFAFLCTFFLFLSQNQNHVDISRKNDKDEKLAVRYIYQQILSGVVTFGEQGFATDMFRYLSAHLDSQAQQACGIVILSHFDNFHIGVVYQQAIVDTLKSTLLKGEDNYYGLFDFCLLMVSDFKETISGEDFKLVFPHEDLFKIFSIDFAVHESGTSFRDLFKIEYRRLQSTKDVVNGLPTFKQVFDGVTRMLTLSVFSSQA